MGLPLFIPSTPTNNTMSAGILSQISFAKETTWGTAVTPNKSIAVRATGGIEIKNNIQMIPAIKGQLQKYYESIKGKVAYEGDFTMDAFADYIGYFILSAMGTDTPALHSGETTVYDHVFSETLPKPSLTIEQAIGENVRRYAGSIVSGFKISGKVGEMLEFSPTIMSKTQATSSQITGAFSTVPSFNHAQIQVKIDENLIGEVESIELNYKNGLDMVHTLGNVEPSYNSIQGGSELTGKIDMYLDSTSRAKLDNYINKTDQSIRLTATGLAIGTAANYLLDVFINRTTNTAGDTKITDNHNMLTIDFSAIRNPGLSSLAAITLTNSLATY